MEGNASRNMDGLAAADESAAATTNADPRLTSA